ncbi:hypothetical protein EON65_39440, partial [archaeon]
MKKKSKNKKEAAKLLEYIYIVERGLQACEIIQAVAEKDPAKREGFLEEAGLQEMGKVEIEEGRLRVTLTLLQPLQPPNTPTLSSSSDNTTLPTSPPRPSELFLILTGGARSVTTEVIQLLHLLHKERGGEVGGLPLPVTAHPPLFRLAL